ncbi:MAG TPA: hypothetical protein VMG11_12165 [Steroidobacteraceae bacterium]|nr:hypothetical protein [Steroidobacteraceae bacterium]
MRTATLIGSISGATPWWAALLVALACSRIAAAQEAVFVPQAQLTGSWASNRQLTIPASPSSEGLLGIFGGDLLLRNPTSTFDVRPLFTVQGDTNYSNLDRWEGLIDMIGHSQSLKGEYNVLLEYHREDAFNAQYGIVAYNPLNPNAPDTSGTGKIETGITKSTYEVAPDFSYELTQRFSIGGDATLAAVRYSQQFAGFMVSYNSPSVELNGGYKLSQRSQITIGPYYTVYDPVDTDQGSVKSTGYGLDFKYQFKWSKVSQMKLQLKVEHDTSSAARGVTPPSEGSQPFDIPASSATVVGVEWVGINRFETSTIQYSVGRFLEPSSFGGRVTNNQLRAQYVKRFSPRFQAVGAVRLTRTTEVGDNVTFGNDCTCDRGLARVSLSTLLTPEWTLSGGYQGVYQNLHQNVPDEPNSAWSQGVFITVEYHGQQPPQ